MNETFLLLLLFILGLSADSPKYPGNLLFAKVYPLNSNGIQNGRPLIAYLKPVDKSNTEYQILDENEKDEHIKKVTGELEELNEKFNKLNAMTKANADQTFQDDSSGNNLFMDEEVFECEGVTCPRETVSCKIFVASNQPFNNLITTTVYCMNKDKVLKKDQKSIKNPHIGNSINQSKSKYRYADNLKFNKFSEELNKTMKQKLELGDLHKSMNIFSNGFFANNPYMPKMNMNMNMPKMMNMTNMFG